MDTQNPGNPDASQNPQNEQGLGTSPQSQPTDFASHQVPAPARRRMGPVTLILVLSGVFFILFLAFSAAFLFPKKSDTGAARKTGASLFSKGSVGVIELNGVIMDSKRMLKQLESFERSEDIKALVLRINSPGGAVAPSQEIFDAVKSFKKPVVASMSSVAASGGYYIACGTKKIFASPGTITGSIGVIMEFANLEKLYEWAKIKRFAIKTGKFKSIGAEYREMTEEERQLLQAMVDDVLSQFKKAVSEGRHLPLEKVDAIADGRIFSGQQAKAAHLVDELGGLKEAVHEAAKMAGIKGEPSVIYPEKPHRRILDLLMDEGSEEASEAENTVLGGLARVLRGEAGAGQSLQQSITGVSPGIYFLWSGSH